MTNNQSPNQDQADLREQLEELVLEIGRQVTDNYTWKNGLWEGLSIENVQSIDRYEKAIEAYCLKRETTARIDELGRFAMSLDVKGYYPKRYTELSTTLNPKENTK